MEKSNYCAHVIVLKNFFLTPSLSKDSIPYKRCPCAYSLLEPVLKDKGVVPYLVGTQYDYGPQTDETLQRIGLICKAKTRGCPGLFSSHSIWNPFDKTKVTPYLVGARYDHYGPQTDKTLKNDLYGHMI